MKNGRVRQMRFGSSAFFILLLIACTAVRVVLALLSEAGTVCRDETLNLELAQNICLYGKMNVYGTQSGFSSILYPVLLSRFFGIGDPDVRMKAVSVLNALLISSALIPGWLLCRKVLKKDIQRIIALTLFAASASFWFSESYMAECLFIPLAMWEIWFLLLAFENGIPGPLMSGALGLWTYLVFITAPAGTAMAVGALALFVYEAVQGAAGKKVLTGFLSFTATFVIAYLLVMVICFSGKPYLYPEFTGSAVDSPEKLLFGMYAGLYAFLWFAAGMLFFPVLVPVAFRKEQDDRRKRMTVLLLSCAVAAACLTAYAVSVGEDFARMDIRIVLRYFIPACSLLVPLFIVESKNGGQESVKNPLVRTAAGAAVLCALFLRIPRMENPLDAPALQMLGTLNNGNLMMIALRAAAVLLIGAGTVLWIKGRGKLVTGVILTTLLILNVGNGILTLKSIRQIKTEVSAAQRTEAKTLGSCLGSLDGTVLFTISDPGSSVQRLADLYCDSDHYLVRTETLRELAVHSGEPGVVRLEETEREKAGLPEQADYIVCDPGEQTLNGERYRECTPEGVNFMKVYHNEDPGRIDAADLFALRAGNTIRFTTEDPDYQDFPISGFSHSESGFTWTEGKEANIMFMPVSEAGKSLDLIWTRKMIIGKEQRCLVYADDELLYDGTVTGGGELRIPVPEEITEKGRLITFRFVLPDAKRPENGDQRVLAVAFVSVSLAERQN